MKVIESIDGRVKNLESLMALRDGRYTKKLDAIVESVVPKFKTTIHFPMATVDELEALNSRYMAGTEKFKNELVIIQIRLNI